MQPTSKTFTAAAIAISMLAGCMGGATSPEDLPPPPSVAEVTRVANISFANTHSFPPVEVAVTKINSGDFLGPGMYDYYACLTATERAQSQTFQRGRVIRDIGDLYDVDYIMHLRLYDHGWGSGILRKVCTGTKIGLAQTTSLCP